MWNETELQQVVRGSTEDALAELDTIGAPAEQAQAATVETAAPQPQPIASAAGGAVRFTTAIDTWHKRQAAYDAKPDTFEKLLGQRRREQKREDWRAEYKIRVDRPVRGYERDQTPERRKKKKAAKSKQERADRLARMTPEEIDAFRTANQKREQERRLQAKLQKEAEAKAEREAMEKLSNYGRF